MALGCGHQASSESKVCKKCHPSEIPEPSEKAFEKRKRNTLLLVHFAGRREAFLHQTWIPDSNWMAKSPPSKITFQQRWREWASQQAPLFSCWPPTWSTITYWVNHYHQQRESEETMGRTINHYLGRTLKFARSLINITHTHTFHSVGDSLWCVLLAGFFAVNSYIRWFCYQPIGKLTICDSWRKNVTK